MEAPPPELHDASEAKVGVDRLVVGWREWLALPELGIPAIKAKIDTGARTSSLHARDIDPYVADDGTERVRFGLRPDHKNPDFVIPCEAPLSDHRQVRSSSGHPEHRYFILTAVEIGNVIWEIEVSLTCRKTMRFRMLLGREALRGRCIVEPHTSFLTGRKLAKHYRRMTEG